MSTPAPTFTIRPLEPADWPAVRRIYEEGIATGNATFEAAAPSWEAWDAGHLPTCRLVAADGDRLLGWTALRPTSGRPVYAGVAEEAVYVAAEARGRGVGRALLEAVIAESERHGLWTLRAGIFPENTASRALHERCGFRLVGRQERIGRTQDGRWRDDLLFERRSRVVGCET